MTGLIKFFNDKDGNNYGFVTGENGKDYFMHLSNWDGEGTPVKGTEVTFIPLSGKKGEIATKVKQA